MRKERAKSDSKIKTNLKAMLEKYKYKKDNGWKEVRKQKCNLEF